MGRRGLVLILFGVAWMIYGSAFFLDGAMGTGGHFVHEKLPPVVQGVAWLACGLAAIVASALHRGKRSDTFGYLAAFLPPTITAVSFLTGAFTYAFEGNYTMALLGLVGLALWGDFATIIGVCASWPEEPALPGGDHE